jgi:UDP-N-acetylglucosamine 2-epimerase
MHPRTRKTLRVARLKLPKNIRAVEPVSYIEMIALQNQSAGVWTDSGGMQKEAAVLGKRCFTLRDETEWVETVKSGSNRLVGANPREIRAALKEAEKKTHRAPFPTRKFYGDGRAAQKIARILSSDYLFGR